MYVYHKFIHLDLYLIAEMLKILFVCILLSLLPHLIQADKDEDLSILSISSSPFSLIRPIFSSARGGSLIYIRVAGNDLEGNNIAIFVGTFPCLVKQASDSLVICETTDVGSSSNINGLQLTLTRKGKIYKSNYPDYVYLTSTPKINEVFPTAGIAKSNVYFYGSNYISKTGDGKEDTGDVKQLLIGDTQCSMFDMVQSNIYSIIKCSQPSSLQAGKYNVTEKLTVGYADKDPLLRKPSLIKGEHFQFAHLPTISSISQNQGQEGGHKLTIAGSSFSKKKKNNSVSIEGNICNIEEVDANKIICTLPPRGNSGSVKLLSNSGNQTNGFIAGAGLNYERYYYMSLSSFITSVRNKSKSLTLQQRGFRAQIKQYNYGPSNIAETWNGYFTAPSSGVYTFRGIAGYNFAMYLSDVEGSTQLPADPFIYSNSPFNSWTNFYYEDIYTAERSINLTAGRSYYLQAYRTYSYGGTNYFRISVDVPNNDKSLLYQAYQVHKIMTYADVQPEVIVYSFIGGGSGSVNLKIVRTYDDGSIYYNTNYNVTYGCSADAFKTALNRFDSFSPYMPSVVRNIYDSSNNLTNSTVNASRIDYVVSLYLLRDATLQQQNFIVTKNGFTGNFTKSMLSQHSPLITGTFSLNIGGLLLNNGSIDYSVYPNQLQNYFRTINGYENVQVQQRTVYGCSYSCWWIISYKGVNAPIPNITLSSASLSGGSNPPIVNMTIRRSYSSHITFDPIDYRFLSTYSNVTNVLVTTNGLPAVCTGNCTYQFNKVATIQSISLDSETLSLSINNRSKVSISDIAITLNGIPCKVSSSSTLSNLKCSIAKNNDGSLPLMAGRVSLQVYIKSIGIIQPENGISLPVVPLAVSSALSLSGGVNGGSKNQLFGSGFTPNPSQISIIVCNRAATIISSSYSQILFYMPSCQNAGNQAINVKIGDQSTSSILYNYIASTGPLIASLSPTSSNPAIKTTLKITGSGFGVNQTAIQVFLSNATGKIYRLKIISINNTTIVVGLSGGEPGVYTVQVTLDSQEGDSQPVNVGADQFSYSCTITSVSPNTGSFFGGALLTIQGTNFSPAYSDTLVYIGYTLNWFCSIETITTTKITCRTPPISYEYSVNETLQVVISTKLYVLNSCPSKNCNFIYLYREISPQLAQISPKTITTQTVTLNGSNFIFNSSQNNSTDAFQIVLASISNSSEIYIFNPSNYNGTYGSFNASKNIPEGDYSVRVRNTVGQSNSIPLTIQCVLGSINSYYGSIAGSIITFTRGSNYPVRLDAYSVKLYNYNKQTTTNAIVVSCCANNTVSILVPAVQSDTYFGISIMSTKNGDYSVNYYANLSYTPKLLLLSNSTISSGLNNLILQRNDTQSVQISSFILVSTINNMENITIKNWTKINTTTYSLSVSLNAGSYKIMALTELGYCLIKSSISVTLSSGATITSKPASFAGDSVTIKGQYLSPSSYLSINGLKGTIINYTPTSVTYNVPSFKPSSQMIQVNDRQDKIDPQIFTVISDQNVAVFNGSAIIDGDIKTVYGSSNQNCWVGIDVGSKLAVQIDKIRYFPALYLNNVVNKLLDAQFQGSNDLSNWTNIASINANAHFGWNRLKASAVSFYRYIRMRHNSTSRCGIAQIQFYGIIYSSSPASSTSQFVTATYNDGFNSVPFNDALEFREDHTPIVQSVTPSFGDIFGGYQITIKGSYLTFGEQVVLIDQIPCVKVSSNSTQIICTVGARPQLPTSPSFVITVNGSKAIINKVFSYVLKWSDPRTWGVDLPPVDGDLVYIPAGMTLLVDEDTPNLLGIAAQNATLIFPNNKDITVTTQFITMIGGNLIAGKQSDPLLSNLNIILTGDYYGKQQPTFGNKGIGCLDCKMSIYGKPRNPVWTTIAATISPGDTALVVSEDVDWQVGQSIAVASTSFFHNESEQRTIVAISNRTITVDNPFNNEHLSLIEQYGSDQLVMKAEVGLLTRNIKIMGDNSSYIKQYGSHILATSKAFNTLQVQIAYTELTRCGQPQIPGRYCINFNGAKDVSTSYIRGNSIYSSYARMIALYNTNYLTIDNNVGYRNKGHNIYLSSGTQIHNVIKNNLVISAMSINFMMQSDQSPSSFWITHPTNDIYGNHIAGSDYNGLYYQINSFSDIYGDICPSGGVLGLVTNNVIHSNKQFGMRMSNLIARTYPCNPSKNETQTDDLWLANPSYPSVLHNFTIYKNGGEGVLAQNIGHFMLNNFILADNKVAGVEMEVANFTKEMVSINNSVIIGQSKLNFNSNSTNYTNMIGVITPRTGQSNLTNVRFYNFPISTTVITTCSKCSSSSYLTNVGNELFFKQISFDKIEGKYLSMLGQTKEIIYDMDGSLSRYFFNTSQPSGTIVSNFNHITKFNIDHCKLSSYSSWSGFVMCDSSLILRRIMLTNAIANSTTNYYGLNFATINILPIQDINTIMNSSNMNTSLVTSFGTAYSPTEKPYSWSFPFVTGTTYQIWWTNYIDFEHLSITTTPIYQPTDLGVVFKFPYKINRQLYNIGPMRGFQLLTASQFVTQSTDNPSPSTCVNGQYRHVNDPESARMLAICQSGKNKTKYEYTEINGIYCKNYCPAPPNATATGNSTKQNFVRLWSNATQWPKGIVPLKGEDVYINASWTVLIDMNPNPAKFMLIDGTLIADDTRDIYFTAKSIHIRTGNISIGSPNTTFKHKFIIEVNNTVVDSTGWKIDQFFTGNKFLVVTGSLNLYGTPPETTSTYLTQTAFNGDSKIFVASLKGWSVGDSIVLSPSFGKYDESERVTINTLNSTDGSVTIVQTLKYTHYGSNQLVSSKYGSVDVNTQVGHMDRNIKIISGIDKSYAMSLIVYGYWYNNTRFVGSANLFGVQVEGINSLKFFNALNGNLSSTIAFSSFANTIQSFVDIQTSNKISFTNNIFFRSYGTGISVLALKALTFTSNLMIGVQNGGCFYTNNYVNPTTGSTAIKDNFCLGSTGFGFAFPLILCSELQTNPMANNTAGSCRVGFIFNDIATADKCKAFSYIKAYACKYGQIANPTSTSKLIFQNFILADNQRGVTLRFNDAEGGSDHVALLSNSYIAAVSRPSCAQCYGSGKISCENNTGVQLLSVSSNGVSQYFPYTNYETFDEITSAQHLFSQAFITNVIFDGYRSSYSSLSQCKDNYIFRPHRQAYDAVAQHSLFDCQCTNCDNASYLLADPNDPAQIGWEGGCGDIMCTGKSNYLIIDWNGTVFGSVGTLIPNNMAIGSNEQSCTFVSHMNAHFCQGTGFATVGSQSIASDYNTRIMWPLTLAYDGSSYSTAINGWREWNWANGVPQNKRLGRFLSIMKLNSTYNMTFKSMAPVSMNFQIVKRTPSNTISNESNYVVIKLRYPLPNFIRIYANNQVMPSILLTDSGLKRKINTSLCGDNVYYYTNYTTNFVVTQGACTIRLELVETIQLTTHFAMSPDQFFVNTVLSSFLSNLCALLGIKDTSRVKVVGVYSGSVIIQTVIVPTVSVADNSTSNSTSSNQLNVTDSNASTSDLAQMKQNLGALIQNGTYANSMQNAVNATMTTVSVTHLPQPTIPTLQNSNDSRSERFSTQKIIGIVLGVSIPIILIILFIISCLTKVKVVNTKLVQVSQVNQTTISCHDEKAQEMKNHPNISLDQCLGQKIVHEQKCQRKREQGPEKKKPDFQFLDIRNDEVIIMEAEE